MARMTLAQKSAFVASCPTKTCQLRQATGGKRYAVKCDPCFQREQASKRHVREAALT